MPISKHLRPLYPADWKEISRRIRFERAGNHCERCGIANGATRESFSRAASREPRAATIVLTVAHLDHNPANNTESNLAALCQRCHNRHDAKHRSVNAAETRRDKRAKRLPFAWPATCAHCTASLGVFAAPGWHGQPALCGTCLVSSLDGQKPLLPISAGAAR